MKRRLPKLFIQIAVMVLVIQLPRSDGEISTPRFSVIRRVYANLGVPEMADVLRKKLSTPEFKAMSELAEVLLTKGIFFPDRDYPHIEDTEFQRILCYFTSLGVASYEGGGAFQPLNEESFGGKGKQLLSLLERCIETEFSMSEEGHVAMRWDYAGDFLDPGEDLLEREPASVTPVIKDPLLAKIYSQEAALLALRGEGDSLGHRLFKVCLQGVRSQMGSGEFNIEKLALDFTKHVLQQEGVPFVKSLMESPRQGYSFIEMKNARILTKTTAFPHMDLFSDIFLGDVIKAVAEGDVKVRAKIGKDSLYFGFQLDF